ncbi:hypothetical protein [Tumebacillus permanentifrigoris]|uniref:Uncharacterized protein n=1 Tax=Tumebacillus permanentifrigoris TaxID=378543 RepID=A0A316DAB6_9BACL|nr:hypothetical protein [Tumebacillus permanentifrigoris]PWK14318.1 hypothetical protein C7459_10572 [Tumebacillus permanentifrigoris]
MTVVPSLLDAEVNTYVNKMFRRYHLLGQGESMQVLFDQQKVLGIELDPFYELYLQFITGEFVWLAETNEFSVEDRLYFLLVTYFYILFPYTMTGRVEKALERLASTTHQTVTELGIEEGFAIPVALTETVAYFVAGQFDRMEESLNRIGAMVESSPYLRESGNYRLVCGLWELHEGRKDAGKALLDEGFAVLRQSKFVPQNLMYLRLIHFFLEQYLDMPDLYREYKALWKEMSTRYNFEVAAQKMREVLRQTLL